MEGAVETDGTEPMTIEDSSVRHVKNVTGGRRSTYRDDFQQGGDGSQGAAATEASKASRPAAVAEVARSDLTQDR